MESTEIVADEFKIEDKLFSEQTWDDRWPDYNFKKVKPVFPRPICRCGNTMLWDKLDCEWECICGRRQQEWRHDESS